MGSIAYLPTFSFHPAKHLTTDEGAMATPVGPERDRRLRNHGIDTDFRQRESAGTWEYDAVELGFNFRLSDINAALGASQVRKVPTWVERRRELDDRYRELIADFPLTVLVEPDRGASQRSDVFAGMRAAGIGVNVHYRPLHLHTTFRRGVFEQHFPVAENAYARLLPLPMWNGLCDAEQGRIVAVLAHVIRGAAAV